MDVAARGLAGAAQTARGGVSSRGWQCKQGSATQQRELEAKAKWIRGARSINKELSAALECRMDGGAVVVDALAVVPLA